MQKTFVRLLALAGVIGTIQFLTTWWETRFVPNMFIEAPLTSQDGRVRIITGKQGGHLAYQILLNDRPFRIFVPSNPSDNLSWMFRAPSDPLLTPQDDPAVIFFAEHPEDRRVRGVLVRRDEAVEVPLGFWGISHGFGFDEDLDRRPMTPTQRRLAEAILGEYHRRIMGIGSGAFGTLRDTKEKYSLYSPPYHADAWVELDGSKSHVPIMLRGQKPRPGTRVRVWMTDTAYPSESLLPETSYIRWEAKQ